MVKPAEAHQTARTTRLKCRRLDPCPGTRAHLRVLASRSNTTGSLAARVSNRKADRRDRNPHTVGAVRIEETKRETEP